MERVFVSHLVSPAHSMAGAMADAVDLLVNVTEQRYAEGLFTQARRIEACRHGIEARLDVAAVGGSDHRTILPDIGIRGSRAAATATDAG